VEAGLIFFEVYLMTQDDFFTILEEDFGIAKTADIYQTKLCNLNLDSLDFAQLKYLLEGRGNIKFSADEEKNLPNYTVDQLLLRLTGCSS
jgi:acyl carrier protein